MGIIKNSVTQTEMALRIMVAQIAGFGNALGRNQSIKTDTANSATEE
jgi:hypothetical protein